MLKDLHFKPMVKTCSLAIPEENLLVAMSLADKICLDKAGNDYGTMNSHLQMKSVLHLDEMADYKSVFENLAHEYIRGHFGENVELRIIKSWLNRASKGAGQHIHTHAGDLTAVMHLNSCKGDLHLWNPVHSSPDIFNFKHFLENRDRIVVSPVAGNVTIFPSYLEHSVDPNPDEQTRYSLIADFEILQHVTLIE